MISKTIDNRHQLVLELDTAYFRVTKYSRNTKKNYANASETKPIFTSNIKGFIAHLKKNRGLKLLLKRTKEIKEFVKITHNQKTLRL